MKIEIKLARENYSRVYDATYRLAMNAELPRLIKVIKTETAAEEISELLDKVDYFFVT